MITNEAAARITPATDTPDDPYRRPQAAITAAPVAGAPDGLITDVRSGQKYVIYAILLYFAAMASSSVVHLVVGALMILASVGLSWVGIYRISRGLGHALWVRISLLLTMLVPLLGLLVLLRLNGQATQRLRAAGYSVGLLGARV